MDGHVVFLLSVNDDKPNLSVLMLILNNFVYESGIMKGRRGKKLDLLLMTQVKILILLKFQVSVKCTKYAMLIEYKGK